MKKIFNLFLKTDIYNRIHKIVGRKVFKLTKIFFVETDFKNLPKSNHPLKINYEEELKKFKIVKKLDVKPFVSYSHILDLVKLCEGFKKNIKIFRLWCWKFRLLLSK